MKGGSSQNPFDNFGPSAGTGGANSGSVGFQDTFANANPSSGKDDFGDLFNKDWLKGAGGGASNVKKKMDSNLYAYNPVDLNSMPAAKA